MTSGAHPVSDHSVSFQKLILNWILRSILTGSEMASADDTVVILAIVNELTYNSLQLVIEYHNFSHCKISVPYSVNNTCVNNTFATM